MKEYIRFYILFLILVFALSIFIIKLGNRFSSEVDARIREMTTTVINGNIKSGEVFVKYNGKIVIKNISVYRRSGELLFIPSVEINVAWLKSILFRRIVIGNIKFLSPKVNLFMEGNRLNIINLFSEKHKNIKKDTSSAEFKSDVNIIINNIELYNGTLDLYVNSFKKKYSSINMAINLKVEKNNLIVNLKYFEAKSDSIKFKIDKGRLEINKSQMRINDIRLRSNQVNMDLVGIVNLDSSIFKFKGTGEGDLDFINFFTTNPIPIGGKCSFNVNGNIYKGQYKITGDLLSNYISYGSYNFTGISGKVRIERDTISFFNTIGYYKHSKIKGKGYYSFNTAVFASNISSDTLILSDIYSNGPDYVNQMKANIKYVDRLKTTYISSKIDNLKYHNNYNLSMRISDNNILIDTFTLKDSLNRLNLSGYYLPNSQKVDFNVTLNKFDLKTVGYLIGNSINGKINGHLGINGYMQNPGVKSNLYIEKFQYKNYSIGYMNIVTNLYSAFKYPKGKLHLNGTNININKFYVEIFNIDGKNIKNKFYIDGNIKSDKGKIDLLCNISLKNRNNGFLIIDSLSGKFYNSDFLARKKGKVIYAGDSIIAKNIDLKLFTGGEISADFSLIKNYLKGQLNIDKFDMVAVKGILPDYNIEGVTNIAIGISGKVNKPSISALIVADSLILNRTLFNKFKCDIDYGNKVIVLNDLHFYKGDCYSWAKGGMDISHIPSGKFQFSLNSIPFNLIPNNDFVYIDSGFISIMGSIGGTIEEPAFNFTGNADNISFKLPDYGVNVQKMIFNVIGKDNRIIVSNILAGTENYGYFKGNGIVSYNQGRLQYYKFNAEVNDFNVKYYDILNGVVSGTAYINGSKDYLNLNSNLKVHNMDINISFREPSVFVQTKGNGGSSFKTDYNVSLGIGNNVWFRNEDMEVEIGGNINLRNYGKNVFINGSVSTKRGYYYYFDRAFNIKKGLMQFTNTSDFNPIISIQSETKISHISQENGHYEKQNITVHLDASGKAKKPEISLYSTPPKSIISILSLLNVNLTPDELTKLNIIGVNLSEKILNYYIRTKIISNIQKKLGIDIFDIETSLLSQNKYARINVGKYLASNFFVSYSHDIFSQSQDEFRLDYYFRNGINLFGERDYTGRFNFGVGFIYRY